MENGKLGWEVGFILLPLNFIWAMCPIWTVGLVGFLFPNMLSICSLPLCLPLCRTISRLEWIGMWKGTGEMGRPMCPGVKNTALTRCERHPLYWLLAGEVFQRRRLLVSVSPSMHLIFGPGGDSHLSPQTAEENNSAPVLLFLLLFLNFQCENLAADLLGFLKRSAVRSQSMLMLCTSPKWFAYGFFWEYGGEYVCMCKS